MKPPFCRAGWFCASGAYFPSHTLKKNLRVWAVVGQGIVHSRWDDRVDLTMDDPVALEVS